MLRGTRAAHVRFLIAWFTNLGGAQLQAKVGRGGLRPLGCEVVEVRYVPGTPPGVSETPSRLLALIELSGDETRVSFVDPTYERMIWTALSRLEEKFGGGKP